MKIGVPIIGGKLDGQRYPLKSNVSFKADGETYISLTFKEGNEQRMLYMVAGMSPAGAIGILRGREKDGKA
jgi:hypothetical protein